MIKQRANCAGKVFVKFYIYYCNNKNCKVVNVACQFNPVSRSYPVVSRLPPSTDGGCFGT